MSNLITNMLGWDDPKWQKSRNVKRMAEALSAIQMTMRVSGADTNDHYLRDQYVLELANWAIGMRKDRPEKPEGMSDWMKSWIA